MKYLILAVTLLTAGCSRQSEPAEAPKAAAAKRQGPKATMLANPFVINDRLVLATAPINERQQFEVALGVCAKEECPVLVSLTEQNIALDQQRTSFMAASRDARQVEVGPGFGVGDPTAQPAGLKAWATGSGEKYLATTVRVVELARGFNALLIDQVNGEEDSKRRHELYGVIGSKLKRLWESSEGSGPAATSTVILPQQRKILYFDGFRYLTNDQADTLVTMVLSWDAVGQRIQYGTSMEFLRAAILPGFSTVAEARVVQRKCLGEFYVLPASSFPDAGMRGFVLAMPSVSEQRAREQQAAADRCVGGKRAKVSMLR